MTHTRHLTTSEVAARLGVSTRTVQRLVEAKRLTATRLPKHLIFDPDDVDRYAGTVAT